MNCIRQSKPLLYNAVFGLINYCGLSLVAPCYPVFAKLIRKSSCAAQKNYNEVAGQRCLRQLYKMHGIPAITAESFIEGVKLAIRK